MLEKLTTAQKAFAGFIAAQLIVIAIALVGWVGNHAVHDRVTALSELEFPAYQAFAELNDVQNAMDGTVSTLLHSRLDPQMRQAHYAELDASLKRIEDARRAAAALPKTPERAGAWADVQAKLDPWLAGTREVAARVRERDAISAGASDPRYSEADARAWQAWMATHERSAAVDESLDRAQQETRRAVKAAQASADRAAEGAGATIVIAQVIAAAALLAIAFLVRASIARVVRGLAGEAKRLTDSVDRGELSVRGDPAAVAVEFRPVVEAMNRTAEAFARPMRLNDQIARKFGNGEVPDVITEELHGEFDALKRNWNAVIESTRMRAADLDVLMKAAMEGRLAVRADASKYEGYNGKLVDAMNGILDAIARPLAEAAAVLERLSKRDLTARMSGSYEGEYARIQEAVNGTAQALHDALAQVATSTEQLSSAAAQITSSSQGVAQAAAGQASSIEETSSQLEEMAGMAKGSADNAQQATALAQSARAAAAQGSDAMSQMGGAMEKIRASAEGTSQIIKDINEIAFQTNLLALNAAVEAARAGDAGRGFAVVAEEVRSLAMRSKEAANKTEALIQESVRQTGEGGATAKLVGEKLSEITTMVGKVSDIVGEIAAAAREQAAGIDQLTDAMSEGNKATQTFAGAAEESSSASLEMSAQSEELAKLVSGFRLEDGAAARPPTPRPSAGPGPAKNRAGPSPGAARSPRPAAGAGRRIAKIASSPSANGFALRPEDVLPLAGDPEFKDF